MSREINEILALLSANRVGQAINLLETLCESEPDNAHAWFLLGAAYGVTGDYAHSVDSCKKSIKLVPDYPDAHFNLSQAQIELGLIDDAIRSLRSCLGLMPGNRKALLSLLSLLTRTGKSSAAEHLAGKYIHTAGPDPELVRNYIEALLDQQKNKEAESYLGANASLVKQHAALSALWAVIAYRKQEFGKAIENYEVAIRLDPEKYDYLVDLALVYLAMADHTHADALFRQALDICREDPRARSAYLFSLNYHMEDGSRIAELHAGLMKSPREQLDDLKPMARQPGDRIRIGYVSPDFRRHSVAFFIEPVIQKHNRDKFEIFCYSMVSQPDDTTRRIMEYSDHWRDIAAVTASSVRNMVRDDGIDILVDLAGHSSHDSISIFSTRSAPVQATYLGYPNTTGLDAMDFRLSDHWADPPGRVPDACSETIIRLKRGFLCYRPPAEACRLAVSGRVGENVTFGSFNNFSKITPYVIRCWAQILSRVPGSRLVIKNKAMGSGELRHRLIERFCNEGVESSRLELAGHVNDRQDHLKMYHDIDIALDTFPYNGTTTTCEALWMGVPVITLEGDAHASRVGSSLLHQAGMSGYINSDVQAYIECAVLTAGNIKGLIELKAELRNKVQTSALCDEEGFVATLEDSYSEMITTRPVS